MRRLFIQRLLRLAIPLLGICTGSASAQSTVVLKLNEGVTLPSVGTVTFVFAHDERCHVEEQCFAAGGAYALLWVELGAKKGLVGVATSQQRLRDIEVSNKFFGTEFCFVRLEPKPSLDSPVAPQARTLTFSVQRSASLASRCAGGA